MGWNRRIGYRRYCDKDQKCWRTHILYEELILKRKCFTQSLSFGERRRDALSTTREQVSKIDQCSFLKVALAARLASAYTIPLSLGAKPKSKIVSLVLAPSLSSSKRRSLTIAARTARPSLFICLTFCGTHWPASLPLEPRIRFTEFSLCPTDMFCWTPRRT